jgi:Ca2+-binding EF-hand superfamily protein
MDKVRNQMNSHGSSTIRSLGKQFNTTGDAPNRRVEGQSFFVGINQNGVTLNKDEIDCLLSGLNTDNDGVVDFDLFLSSLRGQLNPNRIAVTQKYFYKFDPAHNERVAASDLRVAFKSNAHPKVISGEITEDEAFLEFLTNFGDKNNDG